MVQLVTNGRGDGEGEVKRGREGSKRMEEDRDRPVYQHQLCPSRLGYSSLSLLPDLLYVGLPFQGYWYVSRSRYMLHTKSRMGGGEST